MHTWPLSTVPQFVTHTGRSVPLHKAMWLSHGSTKYRDQHPWSTSYQIRIKSGYLFFVDRKKNIIRRSGENISSAQVEASLLNIDEIKSAAVCAYPHKVYDEEVLAFLILKNKEYESKKFAKNIIYKLSKNLAYFKLPAYIQFTDNLPVTSSQKIKKGELIKRIKKQTKFKLYDFSDYKKSFRIN